MQKAFHIRTTVQPGGKVEFASPELEVGQTVDVVVRRQRRNTIMCIFALRTGENA